MNGGAWAAVAAALIAAILAPWVKARIDRNNTDRKDAQTAKAELASSVDKRLDRLLKEYDETREEHRAERASWRSEADDLRARLRMLEQEVAEWRAGMHGVVGVWVAVPAHIWEMVRNALPDLPTTRFPGERTEVEEPGALEP